MNNKIENDCCEKCYSTWTEKDYPMHTTYDACINLSCPCHQCCEKPRKTVLVSTLKGRRPICNNCGKDWTTPKVENEVSTGYFEEVEHRPKGTAFKISRFSPETYKKTEELVSLPEDWRKMEECIGDCAFDSSLHWDREHCGRLPDGPIVASSTDWEEEWTKLCRSKESFDLDYHSEELLNWIAEKKKEWEEKALLKGSRSRIVHQIREEERGKIINKVGMLRQWLNEDRITDPKKMVTNEAIIHWLK